MKVELITPEKYTDDFVVDCARVSFAKRSDQFTPEQNAKLIRYLNSPPDSVPHWAPFAGPRICFGFGMALTPESWAKFLTHANLAGFSWAALGYDAYQINGSLWAWKENLHLLPKFHAQAIQNCLVDMFPICAGVFGWEQTGMSFPQVQANRASTVYENLRIKAPIFVARQLVKHQVHLAWSEVSRRYVKDRPELWWPKEWHKAPTHSKQGASKELFDWPMANYEGLADTIVDNYEYLVSVGLAPEEARILLPQSMMTEWIWTGSIAAFQRVCRERLAPGAQGATREVAQMIDSALAQKHGSNWREMT